MTTIAIVPDNPQGSPASFRAVAGDVQSSGATVGQALDAVRAQSWAGRSRLPWSLSSPCGQKWEKRIS